MKQFNNERATLHTLVEPLQLPTLYMEEENMDQYFLKFLYLANSNFCPPYQFHTSVRSYYPECEMYNYISRYGRLETVWTPLQLSANGTMSRRGVSWTNTLPLDTGGLNQFLFYFIFTAQDHIEHQPICHDRWIKQKL